MSIFAAYAKGVKGGTTFGLDTFKKGWFAETGTLTGDVAQTIKVDEVLYQGKSKYQDVIVFQNATLGRALVLDGDLQSTEFDEFTYDEMMAYLPINSHPNPKKVLVIGGGDGGVVRELAKHPLVESITQCELDEKVVELTKKFMPGMAKGFDSPKLRLLIEDGEKYMKKNQGEFDVIILDCTDPKAPAVALFQRPFYECLKKALKPGGIVASQGGSFWYDRELVKEMLKMCRSLFPVVEYGATFVPTFPAGQIGHICCSTNPSTNFREPIHKFSDEMLEKMELKYYTEDVHRGAFALPISIAREFGQKWRSK